MLLCNPTVEWEWRTARKFPLALLAPTTAVDPDEVPASGRHVSVSYLMLFQVSIIHSGVTRAESPNLNDTVEVRADSEI